MHWITTETLKMKKIPKETLGAKKEEVLCPNTKEPKKRLKKVLCKNEKAPRSLSLLGPKRRGTSILTHERLKLT
ncbi:hypothetical protein NHP21005_05180 [Helicobacter sp. NHP21005]|nr:hypothetical protein NHP21005_05180 [Helicobacter sp. NHP21005]